MKQPATNQAYAFFFHCQMRWDAYHTLTTIAATIKKEGYLLEIKQDAEIEYLSGTFTEYHTQHKSIDMEMVDAIYLRVEVIEDTEQDDTHNLYCHSRLMAATRQHDGAQ